MYCPMPGGGNLPAGLARHTDTAGSSNKAVAAKASKWNRAMRPGSPTATRMRTIRCPLVVFSLGLGLEKLVITLGTDAVAELGIRVLRDIGINLLPVVFVIANLLAVHANRQQSV